MKRFLFESYAWLPAILLLASCTSYRQNIMFKVPPDYAFQKEVSEVEQSYVIQKNDHFTLSVFTNGGELIIDPNTEGLKTSSDESTREKPAIEYLVDVNGLVKLPLLGEFKLEGLTLREAEEVLQKEYSKYYQQPFVVLQYTNKRVIVLGAPGGQVVPLTNQNVRLTEVLALAKGIDKLSKAQNIRILRGDKVFVADLSTIDGYRNNNMIIQPGDIVYVEPIRRPVSEGFRDYGPIFSIMTSLTTLLIVLLK